MSDEEKKIIIDEDWKSQVEQEKEKAQQEVGDNPAAEGAAQQLPPATFEFLVTSIMTQAFATLGQIPDPETNQAILHFPLAKHHIDTLVMLQSKTEGNLSEDEKEMMEKAVHELQMLYVSMENAVATGQIKSEPLPPSAPAGGNIQI